MRSKKLLSSVFPAGWANRSQPVLCSPRPRGTAEATNSRLATSPSVSICESKTTSPSRPIKRMRSFPSQKPIELSGAAGPTPALRRALSGIGAGSCRKSSIPAQEPVTLWCQRNRGAACWARRWEVWPTETVKPPDAARFARKTISPVPTSTTKPKATSSLTKG